MAKKNTQTVNSTTLSFWKYRDTEDISILVPFRRYIRPPREYGIDYNGPRIVLVKMGDKELWWWKQRLCQNKIYEYDLAIARGCENKPPHTIKTLRYAHNLTTGLIRQQREEIDAEFMPGVADLIIAGGCKLTLVATLAVQEEIKSLPKIPKKLSRMPREPKQISKQTASEILATIHRLIDTINRQGDLDYIAEALTEAAFSIIETKKIPQDVHERWFLDA